MGKNDTASAEERGFGAALLSCAALLVFTQAAGASCPGSGCPSIAFGTEDCPGQGCPAFRQEVREQERYVEVFGAPQSGSDEATPIGERLFLRLSAPEDATALPPGLDGALAEACRVLVQEGVGGVAVIGILPREGDVASAQAQAFSEALGEVCVAPLCDDDCPRIQWRERNRSDELPEPTDGSDQATLLELQVEP